MAGRDVLSMVESSICIKMAVANIIGNTRLIASIFFNGKFWDIANFLGSADEIELTFFVFQLLNLSFALPYIN